MAKVSASTLIRRANATKDKTVAKRLRTQAAKLRREARDKPGMSMKKLVAAAEEQKRGLGGGQAAGSAPMMVMHHDEAIGWREINHDHTIIHPEALEVIRAKAKLKVKPEGVDSFAIGLRSALVDARIAGERKMAVEAEASVAKQMEAQRINVVSAFLAEMAGIAALNRGPLPRCLMVSGYTIARVVDALRQAGYTEDGKEGMKRHNL